MYLFGNWCKNVCIRKTKIKKYLLTKSYIIGYGQLMNQVYMSVWCFVYQEKELSIFVCYQFFKQIRTKFGNKPVYTTDGAYWYNNDVYKWLRLKYIIIYETDQKNIMERFIQQIKDRTECFDDNFPCKIIECERKHVNNWLRLFLLYLYMKTDRTMFTNILIKCS